MLFCKWMELILEGNSMNIHVHTYTYIPYIMQTLPIGAFQYRSWFIIMLILGTNYLVLSLESNFTSTLVG